MLPEFNFSRFVGLFRNILIAPFLQKKNQWLCDDLPDNTASHSDISSPCAALRGRTGVELFSVMNAKRTFFRNVRPCSVAEANQRFDTIICPHLGGHRLR